jgi:monovalent cation:proton antiporter-2 (CPA2) family protein
MAHSGFFLQAFIYLVAAVIAVPLAKRLGLGSVLGYLLAGIIIGPYILGLVGAREGTDVLHFAEFGVVLMLFIIGLELRPELLWRMRRSILGLGAGQVLISALLIAGIAYFFLNEIAPAIAIGLSLALSSTAIVLQSLTEKGLLKNEAGQASFSVLLFQDIAVIPILALIPLLASAGVSGESEAHGVSALPAWLQFLLIVGVLGAIIAGGKYLFRHVFRFIAASGLREVFTAAALLLVIGIALLMEQVGLSAALGTFVAGVVLADNEYRHELETNIEPFKGLLLGLFFIAVGANMDFAVLFAEPGTVFALVLLLLSVKFVILFALGRIFGLRGGHEMLFALALPQAGEFAFVLLSFALQSGVLATTTVSLLLIIVALSMLITPLLLIINEKLIQPRYRDQINAAAEADEIDSKGRKVIIAGFGRFGVNVGRFLRANGIEATVLDNNPENIRVLRRFGFKVYYGDATRPEMLKSAGAKEAWMLIIALDDEEAILHLVEDAQKRYPHLRILSRATDLKHAYELKKRGVFAIRREIYDSAIELGVLALTKLGYTRYQAYSSARMFKDHDEQVTGELFKLWGKDQKAYILEAKRFAEELRTLLSSETDYTQDELDDAWDVQSLRREVQELYGQTEANAEKPTQARE